MPPAVQANQTVEIWQWSYKEDSFRLCLIDAQTNGGSSKSTNIDTLNEIYAFWVIFFHSIRTKLIAPISIWWLFAILFLVRIFSTLKQQPTYTKQTKNLLWRIIKCKSFHLNLEILDMAFIKTNARITKHGNAINTLFQWSLI